MYVEHTMYSIKCNEDGCTFSTGDVSDYTAWGDKDAAQTEWESSELQTIEVIGATGKEYLHYCDKHRRPQCWCNRLGVVNDDPDEDGDWFCLIHAPEGLVE